MGSAAPRERARRSVRPGPTRPADNHLESLIVNPVSSLRAPGYQPATRPNGRRVARTRGQLQTRAARIQARASGLRPLPDAPARQPAGPRIGLESTPERAPTTRPRNRHGAHGIRYPGRKFGEAAERFESRRRRIMFRGIHVSECPAGNLRHHSERRNHRQDTGYRSMTEAIHAERLFSIARVSTGTGSRPSSTTP